MMEVLFFVTNATQPPLSIEQISVTEPCSLVAGGGHVRRLFQIWNRGYKSIFVVAEDVNEALDIAAKSGHIRRAAYYRRFEDMTDRGIAEEPPECGRTGALQRALDHGKSGIASLDARGCWVVNSEDTWPDAPD